MGHASPGSQGSTRYDKGAALRVAAATLALLMYPELTFSHCTFSPLHKVVHFLVRAKSLSVTAHF